MNIESQGVYKGPSVSFRWLSLCINSILSVNCGYFLPDLRYETVLQITEKGIKTDFPHRCPTKGRRIIRPNLT